MKLYFDKRLSDPTYYVQIGIRNGKKVTSKKDVYKRQPPAFPYRAHPAQSANGLPHKPLSPADSDTAGPAPHGAKTHCLP